MAADFEADSDSDSGVAVAQRQCGNIEQGGISVK